MADEENRASYRISMAFWERFNDSYVPFAVVCLAFLSGATSLSAQTLIFPQIADGGGIRTEIILTNPANVEDSGTIAFRDSNGNALSLMFDGMPQSSIGYSIPAGGVLKLESDGAGNTQTGYATVVSDNQNSQITGTIIYNISGFEVSVPGSLLSPQHHVFAEKDSTTDTGIALANPGDQAISIALLLLDQNGQMVDQVPINLLAGTQLAQFIDQIFDGIGPDFQGSLHAQSDSEFAMVGFRQKTSGSLATLSSSTTAFSTDNGSEGEDPCGNALGNGDEIIQGPPGPDGPDRDNPFRSLTVHPTNPNTLIVGTERNGFLKSTDAGVTWERFRSGLRHMDDLYPEIYDIGISKSDPEIVYSITTGGGPGPLTGNLPSTSGGAYKSEDGGRTWSRINCGIQQNGGRTTAVYADPANSLHAILAISGGETSFFGEGIPAGKYIEGGIYATTDGGATWQRLDAAPNDERSEYVYFRAASSNPSMLFTFALNRDNPDLSPGFLKSIDGGNTWSQFAPSMQKKAITYFDVSADGMRLYAIADSDLDRALYRSNDAGNTWEQFPIFSSGYTLTVSPQDVDRVLFGQIDGLYLSTDGLGTSNRVLASDERMSDLVFAPSNPSIVYAITQGYVLYKSTDEGDSFTQIKNLRNDVLNSNP